MSPADLTDLRSELAFHADQAGPADQPGHTRGAARLAAVRGRIRTRRRRRVAAGAALAGTAVLAAIVLTPSVSGLRADRAPAPASRPHPEGTGRADPLVFTPADAGDRLIASNVGAAGETSVTFPLTPGDTNISVSAFCRLAPTVPTSKLPSAEVEVNGKSVLQVTCGPDGAAGTGGMQERDAPAANRSAWAAFGLRRGRPNTIRVFVIGDPARAQTAGLRLGVGIYQLDGPRTVTPGGVVLRQLIDYEGHPYRLGNFRTADVTRTRTSLSLPAPAERYPDLVIGGSHGDHVTGTVHLLVDGRETSLSDGGGVIVQAVDDARAHTLGVRLHGHGPGQLVVGYYYRIG